MAYRMARLPMTLSELEGNLLFCTARRRLGVTQRVARSIGVNQDLSV